MTRFEDKGFDSRRFAGKGFEDRMPRPTYEEQRANRTMELTAIAYMAGGHAEMNRMNDFLQTTGEADASLSERAEWELRAYRLLINAWDQGGKEAFLSALHTLYPGSPDDALRDA